MRNLQIFLLVLFTVLLIVFIEFEFYDSLYSLGQRHTLYLEKLSEVQLELMKEKIFERPLPRLEAYKGPSCKSCDVKICDCINYIPNPPIGKLKLKEGQNTDMIDSYIKLMKNTVLNYVYEPTPSKIDGNSWSGLEENAMTMVGLRRIDNVQALMEDVLINNVRGDFIETGVWRGGVCAVVGAMFTAYEQWNERNIWLADSFEGIPHVNTKDYPEDSIYEGNEEWSILVNNSLEKVVGYFERVALNRPQVKWLKGWFKDTLPQFRRRRDTRFAIIRLDGDIFESTIQSLQYLYPFLSIGGYVIIDDFTDWVGCRKAVLQYREACKITDEESPIVLAYHLPEEQYRGVYWKKVKEVDMYCWERARRQHKILHSSQSQ